jgi:hypothetical protein
MTEAEVIQAMREHLERQFPKTCPKCQRLYPNLHAYILTTSRMEPSICYDADAEDWQPRQPVGTLTYVNCPCGSTLALSSRGMPLLKLWSLYHWAKTQKQARGISMNELLRDLRDQIRAQVLTDSVKQRTKVYPS